MQEPQFVSPHFNLQKLAKGVYAAIGTPDGLAYSNAAIIDTGDETLVLDCFETLAAARDLRHAAENLFRRPVAKLIISHPHSDHWNGNAAFDKRTTILSTRSTYASIDEEAGELPALKADPGEYTDWLRERREQLRTEPDVRWRANLENSIRRVEHELETLPEFEIRLPDEVFEGDQDFSGPGRRVQLVQAGAVHSASDSYLVLPDDGLVFLADIGFFGQQPFMAFCDLDAWRAQIDFHLNSEYEAFVPGHGEVGGKEELRQQWAYMDMLERLVREALAAGGEEVARRVEPEAPFSAWLMGAMSRLEANIGYMIKYVQGKPAR